MKVARVEAIPLEVKFDKPWRTGVASFTGYYMALVRVTTDDGLIGYGECLARYQPRAWADLVNDVLGPQVIGEDPFDVEWIWNHLYRSFGSFSGHSRGIFVEAMSGIDIALWDLMGKATGKPVHKLLGGFKRDKIAAYASSVLVQEDDAMVESAVGMIERGFTSLKVKIGRPAAKERQVLSAIREAVGDEVMIVVDANCAYRYAEAVKIAEVLEELDIAWFEEPVATEDRRGYRKMRQATTVPLAGGEGEFTRFGMHELLETDAIDVIQPDVSRSGGITETRKIWTLATLYNARYAPHVGASGAVCAAASVHLAASAPNFYTYECSVNPNPLRDELTLEPVGHGSQVVDGYLPVPDRHGLGIEIDERVVEKYRLRG
jgi:D-galactarolactone cycloisomerase